MLIKRMMIVKMLQEKIRISIGSASKLGLRKVAMAVKPTNIHLLTFNSNGCNANCAFCPQSRYTFQKLQEIPNSQEFLSRVTWPEFELSRLLQALEQKFSDFSTDPSGFQRICLQALNYPNFEFDVLDIIKKLKNVTNLPISLAIPPVTAELMHKYKGLGVDRICFALDAATRNLFENIKGSKINGPYSWDDHINHLETAVNIFGRSFVTTHLILGFGESEYDALNFIQMMKKKGIITGLFAFFPIKNTQFEKKKRPNKISFRKIQLGKFLIDTGRKRLEDFKFDEKGTLIDFNIGLHTMKSIISKGRPFQTSGCPGCNRPFYTSRPSEEQYNYPRKLLENEKSVILNELKNFSDNI